MATVVNVTPDLVTTQGITAVFCEVTIVNWDFVVVNCELDDKSVKNGFEGFVSNVKCGVVAILFVVGVAKSNANVVCGVADEICALLGDCAVDGNGFANVGWDADW